MVIYAVPVLTFMSISTSVLASIVTAVTFAVACASSPSCANGSGGDDALPGRCLSTFSFLLRVAKTSLGIAGVIPAMFGTRCASACSLTCAML